MSDDNITIEEEYDPLDDNDEEDTVSITEEVVVEPVVKAIEPKKENQLISTYSEVKKDKKFPRDKTLYLPPILVTDKDLKECAEKCYEMAKEVQADENAILTLKEIVDAFETFSRTYYQTEYKDFFTNNVGNLVQFVEGDQGKKIGIKPNKLNIDPNLESVKGSAALLLLNVTTKTGIPNSIPLWNSGINLEINTFSETELLDLNIAYRHKNVMIGLDTRGASFSGDDVHIGITTVDFILAHLNKCNIQNVSNTNFNLIRKLMKVTDIPALVTGAASVLYPEGYPVFHPCVNRSTDVNCNYNLTSIRKPTGDFEPDSLLDFRKMLFVDKSKLPPLAASHMSKPWNSFKSEEIIAYQKTLTEFLQVESRKVLLWSRDDSALYMYLKVPTIEEYGVTANNWIASVNKNVEDALSINEGLSVEEREEKRFELLEKYASVTNLNKYIGWVDYFTINGIVVKEYSDIIEYLKTIAMMDEVPRIVEIAVQKFKEDSTISAVGISNYTCPLCGTSQVKEDAKYGSLIPINPLGYFFFIMELRGLTREFLD